MPLAIARIEQPKLPSIATVRRQLAEVETVAKAKEYADKSEAMRKYFKSATDSLELQNKAAEIRIWSCRRLGELLAVMPKHNGDPRSRDVTGVQTLEDIGIAKMQSHRFQRLASLDESEFEAYIAAAKSDGKEITIAGAMRLASKPEASEPKELSLPDCLEQMRRYVERMAQRWPKDDIAALAGQLRSLAKEVADGTLLAEYE